MTAKERRVERWAQALERVWRERGTGPLAPSARRNRIALRIVSAIDRAVREERRATDRAICALQAQLNASRYIAEKEGRSGVASHRQSDIETLQRLRAILTAPRERGKGR